MCHRPPFGLDISTCCDFASGPPCIVRYTCDDRRLFGRGPYDILSGRYNLALPSTPTLNQHMEFDYDFKSTNTDLLNAGCHDLSDDIGIGPVFSDLCNPI